jgi:hypothetical protein
MIVAPCFKTVHGRLKRLSIALAWIVVVGFMVIAVAPGIGHMIIGDDDIPGFWPWQWVAVEFDTKLERLAAWGLTGLLGVLIEILIGLVGGLIATGIVTLVKWIANGSNDD